MKPNKKFDPVTTKILYTGLVILLGCLIACIIHMITLGNIFRNVAEETLLGHMEVALEVINNDVEEQRKITEVCADRLYYDRGEHGIDDILLQCQMEYPDYNFYYVTPDDVTHYASGMTKQEKAFEQISAIHGYEFHDNFICISRQDYNVKGEKLSYWIGISPLQLEEYDEAGYVMTRRPNNELLDNECFDYLSQLGICCIVERDGTVVTADANYVKQLGLGDNVFEDLVAFSNGSAHSESQIHEVRNSLSTQQSGSIEFKSWNGRDVYVAFSEISQTRNRYLMVVFHEDALYEFMQPVLFRSFLLWVIILFIMIVTIGFAWNSGRNAQKTVEKLAFNDDVTGGRNLNFFRKKAAEIINQNRETPFLIYRFDILNFRYINEAYGHGKADMVLKSCVQEFVRIYSKNELCVRINSDHFLALVMNNTEAGQNYQNYMKAIGECARANGVRYPIRLRLGIYQVRKEDNDIDIMIDHANAARKSLNGTEKVLEATYSDKIVSNMKKVDAIESQMQSAIINDEFKIYLQPKWDIVNDRLVGAEALVRWIKDDGSTIYPSDFIPLFETNGFIEKLDFHMLEKLCNRIRDLETEKKYRIVPISVNQSRILINNPDYVKNVEKVISRYDIDIKHLEIEITETVFFDEKNKMVEVVNQLKKLGLQLAMDDFGSGYSSLNILRDIPFDILKIDREFVSESVASNSSIIIMQKIIEMAQGLNIKVICEGVETKEQVDILRRLGCNMVQGYYYDRPLPMDEFLEKYCKPEKNENELSGRT